MVTYLLKYDIFNPAGVDRKSRQSTGTRHSTMAPSKDEFFRALTTGAPYDKDDWIASTVTTKQSQQIILIQKYLEEEL